MREPTVKGAIVPEREETQGQAKDRTVEMPQPTQDQREYLAEIFRSAGQYDPDVTIGGPKKQPRNAA